MLWLVPRDEMRAGFIFYLSKAYIGMHAMLIMAHLTLKDSKPHHIRVYVDLHQLRFAPKPQQYSVKQCEAIGTAMQDDLSRQLDKFSGHLQFIRRSVFARSIDADSLVQQRRLAVDAPLHVTRRNRTRRQRASLPAPTVEIDFARQC